MDNPRDMSPIAGVGGSTRNLHSYRSLMRGTSSGDREAVRSLEPLIEVHEIDEPLEMNVPHTSSPTPTRTVKTKHAKQLAVEVYQLKYEVVSNTFNQWVGKSRFILYQEDREGYDNHYGKPHVPCIAMEYFNALQHIAAKAVFMNDVVYINFATFCKGVKSHNFDPELANLGKIVANILKNRILPKNEFHGRFRRASSSSSLQHTSSFSEERRRNDCSVPCNLENVRLTSNVHQPVVRKISAFDSIKSSLFSPPEEENTADETVDIIVGHVPEMTVCRLVVIRFSSSPIIPELADEKEEAKPCKCLMFILGPQVEISLLEVGRALSAVLSNLKFSGMLDNITQPDHILRLVDLYLAETVVLGPVHIDNKNLLVADVIKKVLNKRADRAQVWQQQKREMSIRSLQIQDAKDKVSEQDENDEKKFKFFGEMIKEVNNRLKFYKSDFTDAANLRVILTSIFMFFACVSPLLTFGSILSLYTDGTIGILQAFRAQAYVGFVWSLFSCQPLLVPSLTGPVVIFDAALDEFCRRMSINYFTVRLYTGFVVFCLSLISASLNGSRLLKFVSAFLEDIFSFLISLILFYETFGRLHRTYVANPPRDYEYYSHIQEICLHEMKFAPNGTMIHKTLDDCVQKPNVFCIDIQLTVYTFFIAGALQYMKNSSWFGSRWRNLVGDFGMVVAILSVTLLYEVVFSTIPVDMIGVPMQYSAAAMAARGTGFFVDHTVEDWVVLAIAIFAGVILYLLVFVEVGIPEIMMQRKERKLVKGGGVHWDVVLNGAIIAVSSLFGLPWMCGAAVQSLAHSQSLTVFKKSAPGESPKPDYVIEQRVTLIIISVLTLITAEYGHIIRIPYQIMFGVLLYLAVMNLHGNKMLKRVGMCFKAAKNRGNDPFLEQVSFGRVQVYTLIQVLCVALVFGIKQSSFAVLFPLVLGAFVPFHRLILPLWFTKDELEALDEENDESEAAEEPEENEDDCYFQTRIPV